MDHITAGFLQEFIESKGYQNLPIDQQFEHFINYCVISKEYDSISFDEQSISTGTATPGIDGIAIIVNNKLCSSIFEIQNLIELNRTLTANFIFIQSKTSNKFQI